MKPLSKKDFKLLNNYGWTIECESPLEIRHEDGSFATLNAVESVLVHCYLKHTHDQQAKIIIKPLKIHGQIFE